MEVILTVDGVAPTVVTHMPVVSSSSHAAVRIIEKINDNVNPHRKDGTRNNSGLDRVSGVARKGLRVRKPINSGKGGFGVVEWVKSSHARIDSLGKQPNIDFGSNSTAMDESQNDYLLSDEKEIWEEDQLVQRADMGDAVDMGEQPVRDLFTSDGNITTDYPTRGRFPHVNSVSLEHLGDPVSDIENGMVYGTNGIGTWSVLAKVKGWYVEQAAGLLQLDGRTPSTAANGPSVRHGHRLETH
ncbi:hypothetical protein V6N13_106267 [Hibiscus sabdariffa]